MISISPFSVNFTSRQPLSEIRPQNTLARPIQETVEIQPPSAPKFSPVLSRLRRDLQNSAINPDPFTVSVRQFADTLVEKEDRQLAVNLGNALVRRERPPAIRGSIDDAYKLTVPLSSTFGQAWSELADALESEPFRSFCEAKLIDISRLVIEPNGDLTETGTEGGFTHFFSQKNPEWSAVSSAVLAASKKVMGQGYPSVSFYGRNHASAYNVAEFYGFSLNGLDAKGRLETAGQLLRDGSFKALSGSDPLDAPIKQKQIEARQRIVDSSPPALTTILERFAPSTAQQRVRRADQELAQLVSRGMMKLLPETSEYETSVTLQDIPRYSTFNLVRENLLKALTDSAFTTFAKENEIDPTSVRINPVSGKLTATVKGVNTTFNLNDVSGWNDAWTEIKEAVQQMAAGSEEDVTYPGKSAALYEVMAFYNEPPPHQEQNTQQADWQQRQLASTLGRIDEMNQNNGFKALIGAAPSDPDSIAVRQRQQAVTQQWVNMPLSYSPLEDLAATVKAHLPAQAASDDSTEDLLASAERELAATVHRAMLELKTNPARITSQNVQPIPDNSLLGQWHTYLNTALTSRGFNEWAREQNVELTSLRYDPTDKALIAKVKGADQRFTATDFAQKYPKHCDVLAPVLNAAQAFAKPGQSISLSHADTRGVPYQWVANFYNLNDAPNSAAFDQQTALIGRTQQFPAPPDNPQEIVAWVNRQKTALGDSNDRYALIHELKNWSPDTGLKRFVVDLNSSHSPKSVTTVAAFIANNDWYPIQSKAASDNLRAALRAEVPTAPPLGNRWGFLSTQLPLSTAQRGALVKEVKNKIGPDETLLNYLSSKIANLEANPQQALEQLLGSDNALELATHLQTQMKGAATPTSLKQWLLTALMLELDPTAGTQHKTVAGADLTGPDNVGRSTLFMRDRFNQYLTTHKNTPAHLAPVVSHLLLSGVAPQLLVSDVPKKVTFGSPEWFNFTAAVNQIEWTAPGATAHMTYQQVMSHYNIEPISALEAQIKSYAQMNPLLDWAALNDKIDKNNYTLDQLKDSQQKLQAQANRTAEAGRWLSANNAPNRRDMALEVLREKFGTGIDYEKRFMVENELAGVISGRHYSLVEIYEAGRLDESWMQEGNHVDFDSLRQKAKEPGFPVINAEFDKAIKADFNLRRRHTATLFEDMLKKLPLEEYKSLLYGDVEFLNVEGAGSGMVVTSVYNGVRRDFAVYPTWGQIVKIADIGPATSLGENVSLEIDAEAFKNGTEPRSGVKSDVILRSTDQHLLDDNNEPWPLEVSFPAHKENDAFSPNYVSGRLSKLAKAMIDSTYLNKAEFLNLHRNGSSNTLETATEPRDFFKALWHALPGASSVEDLYHGQFLKAGADLAIDVAIVLATEGAGKLWGLARSATSWAAAKVSAGFIEKFGVKEAEAIALKDFTAATTTQSTRSLSRLQNSQIIEQTADMANGSVPLSGALDRAKITAIHKEGEWYAYDAKTMAAYGPALERFVSDTSTILKQETFSDGTKALVTEQSLAADAYTVTRARGFDLINEGKVYRYDSRTPGVLRDLESADYYKPLEGFEAYCPAPGIGGRVKRGANDTCFTKVTEEVSGELRQELQALEHVRLFPSATKFLRKDQFVIFERRRWKMVHGEMGPKLHPVPETKPIAYKPKITGTLKNEPEFGFFNAQSSEGLERETRVVKLNRITEAVDDKRELRGVIVDGTASGRPGKYLVIEADTAKFYYARLENAPGSELTFNKCTPNELSMVQAYRNKFSIRQGAANAPFDANFIALPKLRSAFEELERAGYLKKDIDELKTSCNELTEEQQREVIYQLQRAKAIDKADIALKPNQVVALNKPANFTSWTAEQQNKFYAQQAQDNVNRAMKATGLGPSNQMSSKADLARSDAAEMAIGWLRRTAEPGALSRSNLILKSGAGNCGEMSLLSKDIIEKSGGNAQSWYVNGGDHVFTVVGGPASAGKTTLDFSQAEWKDAWIVDPWAEISCKASEYTELVKKKMAEWDAKGRQIYTRKQWRSPVDPQWLKELTSFEKRPY